MSLFSLPFVVSGFVVGFAVGLSGVGGGSLMTPILLIWFHLHPVTAVGTDLLFAAITKSCGTAVHQITHNVEWRLVGLLAAGSVPATAATVLALRHSELAGGRLSGLISHLLGFALLLTALSLVYRRYIMRISTALALNERPRVQTVATILLGAMLGVLVSLSSVGAGAIGIAVLLVLRPRLTVARIVGSDIAHAVPLTLLAGLGHLWIGTANLPLLASLLIGSLPGIVLGSLLTPRVPERFLRFLLAIILAAIGGRLVIA
ncbi:MAG TPA: sulfite exporter TauE/SafE family protein [Steroidobacteraceae bacterium]|nr:sulfite exporter TauE/SafE family protein [Steroidobacteraceae bacterium]